VHAVDRPAAIALMRRALAATKVAGVATTVPLHDAILAHPDFAASPVTTRWFENVFMTAAGRRLDDKQPID
jgi:acetyl-CoA carboxylase biotin carboxylase subunit